MDLQGTEIIDDGWSRVPSEPSCDLSSAWSVVSSVDNPDWDGCSISSQKPNKEKLSYKDAVEKTSSSISGARRHTDSGLPSIKKLLRRSQKNDEKHSQQRAMVNDDAFADHNWSMLEAKPFVDKFQRKHERAGRRRNLHGHTGRRKPNELYSHIGNPVLRGGSDNMLTAIELSRGSSRDHGYRREWTTFLNKSRGWEELPALLEAECVDEPKMTKEFNSIEGHRHVTSYKLKAQVLLRDNKAAKTSEQENRLIFHKPSAATSVKSNKFIPRKLFAEIDLSQPKFVKGSPLAWRVKNQRLPRKGAPTIHSQYCWDVQEDCLRTPGSWGTRPFLEIDLGHSVAVTAISTQGAPPPVRTYPNVKKPWPSDRFQTVEGHQYEGKYDGPYWCVLDPEWFKQPGQHDTRRRDKRLSELRWVRSYEVWWRADRGRTWNPLGVFKGNDDTTTERAHLLSGFQSGSLCCRYLRVVPVDCENGGALRFGVYGDDGMVQSLVVRSSKAKKSDPVEDEDSLVEYKLYEPSDLKTPGTDQRDGLAPAHDKFSYWPDRRPSRSQLKVEAKRQNNY